MDQLQLGNFASLLEIGVALNLAFALLKQVREFGFCSLEKNIDSRLKNWGSYISWKSYAAEDKDLSHAVTLADKKKGDTIKKISKLNNFLFGINILFAIICVSILVLSSFYPKMALTDWQAISVCLVAILPMPTGCLLISATASYYSKQIVKCVENYEEFSTVQSSVADSVENTVENLESATKKSPNDNQYY